MVHLLIYGLFGYFNGREGVKVPAEYPLAASQGHHEPPEPRLQTAPRQDLADMRAKEDEVLGSYGWVDKNAGVVRIPIDAAMKLGAHHPMGPLELADFIGLDTCLSIMQVLHEGLADSKYRPCPLLVKYVEAGWLGRKTQRGFYDYRGDKPVPTR